MNGLTLDEAHLVMVDASESDLAAAGLDKIAVWQLQDRVWDNATAAQKYITMAKQVLALPDYEDRAKANAKAEAEKKAARDAFIAEQQRLRKEWDGKEGYFESGWTGSGYSKVD